MARANVIQCGKLHINVSTPIALSILIHRMPKDAKKWIINDEKYKSFS